jgi:hypothetical protein
LVEVNGLKGEKKRGCVRGEIALFLMRDRRK